MARTANKRRVNGREAYADEIKPAARIDEIGVTGLSAVSGQIQADFLREMRGKEGYKHFNEMRLNSAVIGSLLLAVEQSIRPISWNVSADDEEDERIQFVQECIDGMSHSWNDHITEVLTMLPFGYSLFEIVYKRDERNRLVWRKFAIRGQDTISRWIFDDEGGLSGAEQLDPNTYQSIFIPIEKSLLYRMRVERNNPEGRSILRTAWVSYYMAKNIQIYEGIGVERDLAGLPVITLPPGADTQDTTTSDLGVAKKVVRNVRNDEQAGVVLPSPEWKFELLSTGGQRQFDTDKIVTRHESRMLMSALAQFLMLGQENVGSLALSKDQTDFFTMSVNATADIIAETFTKYAIPRLLVLNGYDPDGIRLEHTLAGDVDTEQIANSLQIIWSFITPSAEDEVWLRQVFGMPERDADELRAEREARDAQREAARQALIDRTQQDNQQSQMMTELYQANAPDDETRRKRERQFERAFMQYFKEAKPRILREARKMRR